jgi:hypothetical protein
LGIGGEMGYTAAGALAKFQSHSGFAKEKRGDF